MTPRGEATAFRIWRAAGQVEWDCTIKAVAEQLDIDPRYAAKIVTAKGWQTRFRASQKYRDHAGYILGDDRLDHPATVSIGAKGVEI